MSTSLFEYKEQDGDLYSRICAFAEDVERFAAVVQRDLDHFRDLKMAARLIGAINDTGEALVCSIFDYFCEFRRDLLLGLDGNGIAGVRKEVTVRCGRVDRLIDHCDGSVTVVEIKGAPDLRAMAGGLGQVLMYAEAVRADCPGKEVRAALVVGGDRASSKWLASACLRADVMLIPVDRETIDDFLADAYAVRCYYKQEARRAEQIAGQ